MVRADRVRSSVRVREKEKSVRVRGRMREKEKGWISKKKQERRDLCE
jgi:hypothetical protein